MKILSHKITSLNKILIHLTSTSPPRPSAAYDSHFQGFLVLEKEALQVKQNTTLMLVFSNFFFAINGIQKFKSTIPIFLYLNKKAQIAKTG
jgi:hypothetical protein